MIKLVLALILLAASSSAASADWELYRRDEAVIASVDYLSYEPYQGHPSVWVRWHYVAPRDGVGGVKIHFTANCQRHRLFELAEYPYDTSGNFLKPHRHYDSPREYPVVAASLGEATYKLLCR